MGVLAVLPSSTVIGGTLTILLLLTPYPLGLLISSFIVGWSGTLCAWGTASRQLAEKRRARSTPNYRQFAASSIDEAATIRTGVMYRGR